MNKFERYYKIESAIRKLEQEKAALKEEIREEVKTQGSSILTPYGHFIKVTKTIWTFSTTHIEWVEQKHRRIDEIKKQIKEREKRVKALGHAESRTEIDFRYDIKKATV